MYAYGYKKRDNFVWINNKRTGTYKTGFRGEDNAFSLPDAYKEPAPKKAIERNR